MLKVAPNPNFSEDQSTNRNISAATIYRKILVLPKSSLTRRWRGFTAIPLVLVLDLVSFQFCRQQHRVQVVSDTKEGNNGLTEEGGLKCHKKAR